MTGLPDGADARQRLLTHVWLTVLARCTGDPQVWAAVADAAGGLTCASARVAGTSWADLVLDIAPLSGRPHSIVDVHRTVARAASDLLLTVDATSGLLQVAYDPAVVGPDAAHRVLGYVEYALERAVAVPGELIDLSGMLTDAECDYQLRELCGPPVANGPDGFVTAFRARAAVQPNRPALHHHDRTTTFAELDAASDRIAHHLWARGVTAGDGVAIVCDRHTEWVIALLGVLKTGAVYLPVRPDFPPARVESQLVRAGCKLALVDAPGAELVAAVTAIGTWAGASVDIAELAATVPADGVVLSDPDLATPAYVYFTSGSTGQPKGAVCRHEGMINHLWAKVDDHRLGPDSVVAQTATQCFDISLWQVCAPLLVGGASVIVDTATQLDVPGFMAQLAQYRVTTAQIVPSYLQVLLTHLEDGRGELPALNSVSVTGEALKADLVRRWFAVVPGVRLVNAYGATEVSDDTMHEVLDGPPQRDLAVVNVGRPLRNMRVYIVDDQLRLVPTGAAGEIVFAGVCVGAGYLNDPDRTATAFQDDPFVPGERLYRSGDRGRWLPERRIEFLGRFDDQVKIRGLRVEMGEVTAALLGVPNISAAAVVTIGEGNRARLVGCYVSEYELASVDLHDLLSAWLPEYMQPAHYLRLAELPLNENGKTDKRRLTQWATELVTSNEAFEPPATPQEQQLATIWAEVLGLPAGRVGRRDLFFDLGGTSLSAIHLLMRVGHRLSLTDVLHRPMLADQAALLESAPSTDNRPLLHRLNDVRASRPVLICLPGAGENAINFQRFSDAAGDRAQVLAVEFPGHDLAHPDECLMPLAELAVRLATEVPVDVEPFLWGRGAGAEAALATAAALERTGRVVGGVVVLRDEDMSDGAVAGLSDQDVADRLTRRRAYVEIDGATPERLALVARAYRHDWEQALRIAESLTDGSGLRCPVIELGSGSAPDATAVLGELDALRSLAPVNV